MKILVDCGHRWGQAIKKLDRLWECVNNPDWEIIAFEPNPAHWPCKHCDGINNITHVRAAVWDHDEKLSFNQCDSGADENKPLEGGSSCVATITPRAPIQQVVPVAGIDFGVFLDSLTCDQLLVKMDIEGAEFQVLRHLLATDRAAMINHLYIEWHDRLFENETGVTVQQIVHQLIAKNVQIHPWE